MGAVEQWLCLQGPKCYPKPCGSEVNAEGKCKVIRKQKRQGGISVIIVKVVCVQRETCTPLLLSGCWAWDSNKRLRNYKGNGRLGPPVKGVGSIIAETGQL